MSFAYSTPDMLKSPLTAAECPSRRWNFPDFVTVIDKEDMARWYPGPADDLTPLTGDPHRPSPRFVKCHLPMSLYQPKMLDVCKVVYVARNPKDLCVSLYHHSRLFYCFDFMGDFEVSFMTAFGKQRLKVIITQRFG